MIRILLTSLVVISGTAVIAQTQIGNSDFESWETVATGQEPVNWNSFLSATGSFASFASDQCVPSSDVRPGSAGTSSCRIFSISTFSIVANGNLTLGQINMGSVTPTAPQNFNYSKTADVNFSEPLTEQPDSLVFWAKFTPVSGSGNARVKASLHTNYDYRDPEDVAAAAEVVATAVLNYPTTGGNWTRFAVPFVYSGPASIANQAFILITFTTNELAGGGTAGDEVLIDDVQLIYNPVGLEEKGSTMMQVSMNDMHNVLVVSSTEELNGTYEVLNLMGQRVQAGNLSKEIPFEQAAGMYIVRVVQNGIASNFEVLRN
ncbi:MAG: hypothetical protein A3D92_06455 [Bacteroidetes bacterium RIFCSPHIGHO2_02_FULL_44_7]|nr:MAG: hypothetical protein A3D92_06455 [Bacteroidetes bacterium RIFCSPHIGHO2_02_FULL_44_7]